MYENFLDENFEIGENRINGVETALNMFSENTVCQTVDPYDFTIWSLLSRRSDQGMELIKISPACADEKLILPENMNQVYFRKGNGTRGLLPFETLKKWGIRQKQIEEIYERGFFLQYHDSDSVITMIPSKAFLATLCRRVGCGKLNEGIDPLRDIYLASRMRNADPFKLVYRKNGVIAKAFGCFSQGFVSNPQTVALDFAEELSKTSPVTIRAWNITHFLTKIDYMFTMNAVVFKRVKITPGIRFILSDVGDASYTMKNVLYINGGMVYLSKGVSRSHQGILDAPGLTQSYIDQAYGELKSISDKLDAMGDTPVESVKKAILELYKKCGLYKAYGKLNSNRFLNRYVMPMSDKPGNKLDAALFILKMPGYIKNRSKFILYEEVANAAGKVFDIA